MIKQLKANGSMYLDKDYIQKWFPERDRDGVHPCELCNMSLDDHDWIELDLEGFATRCSIENGYAVSPDADTNEVDKIMYISLSQHGGVASELPYRTLFEWYRSFETTGNLALGCWEIRRLSTDEFIMRITPSKWPGGREETWHVWEITYQPKQIVVGHN